jgi:hypothetical protein
MLGTHLAALINSVADELPAAALEWLRAFDDREERDKSLQAFAIRTTGEGDEFATADRSTLQSNDRICRDGRGTGASIRGRGLPQSGGETACGACVPARLSGWQTVTPDGTIGRS